ncbi:hypothetical protein HYH03_008881 [Edaphochlamys debaryana]|uniref:Uncharacterized protein n=1 Tax=Edaphochlamys debaryana TaxID=47281 RepID=A0A835XZN8_9CHLO|nr:hypothetical protein HYH03_008881 [Edaphochlamys debaryana]|eukprot:KAG2492975.1 hypothetical protein HYH03_008881 [Edaphochlamys debaryana]
MATTAVRKASTASVAAAPSWEDQLCGVIKEVKAWKGPMDAKLGMGFARRVKQAVNEWQQAPIAAVRGAALLAAAGGPPSDLHPQGQEEEDEFCLPVEYEDQHLIRIEEERATLEACVHPKTRQPVTLPAELSLEALESRLLGSKGRVRSRAEAQTPRDLEALWGPHEDLLLEGSRSYGTQLCTYTFRFTLAVFWPHERTLPCVGGLGPTVRLLEELMGQRPAAAAAGLEPTEARAQGAGRVRADAGAEAGAPAAPLAKRPRQAPGGSGRSAEQPQAQAQALAQTQAQAQAQTQALAQQVLQAALDMAKAADSDAGDMPIPRLVRLLASPEGRRLGPQAGPGPCAALLDVMGAMGGVEGARALAEAAAAFDDPAFNTALLQLIEDCVETELGPCLHLATCQTLPSALSQRMATALLEAVAAPESGVIAGAYPGDVGRLAALVLTGEPPWREHAQAVTAAIVGTGRDCPEHIAAGLAEPAVAQALEARQPRALAFATAALGAVEALHASTPMPPSMGGRGRGMSFGAYATDGRGRAASQQRERLITELRGWLQPCGAQAKRART